MDEPFKASAYAWETLEDPKTGHSTDAAESSFARAMGKKETLWQYWEKPENTFRHHRFSIGMQGIEALQPPDVALMGLFPSVNDLPVAI